MLGSGAFGVIYLAVNTETNEEAAAKLESTNSKHPTLMREVRILRELHGAHGIANVHRWIVEGGYNIMVMDLLGPSLETLFQLCRRKFSLKTVLVLADQMLYRIECLHSRHFIHRDIKPENFVMGRGMQAGILYLIDFGLAKRYRDTAQQHIPYSENKHGVGTPCFASINMHLGIRQSRRDDLESIGYAIMYLIRGHLPWQGLWESEEEHRRVTLEMKQRVTAHDFWRDYSTSAVFPLYFSYCRGLRFQDRPDYAYLRRILKDLFVREGFANDFVFEWWQATIGSSEEASPELVVGSAGAGGGLDAHGNADSGGSTTMAASSSAAPPEGGGTTDQHRVPGSSTGGQRKVGGRLRSSLSSMLGCCSTKMPVMS